MNQKRTSTERGKVYTKTKIRQQRKVKALRREKAKVVIIETHELKMT